MLVPASNTEIPAGLNGVELKGVVHINQLGGQLFD